MAFWMHNSRVGYIIRTLPTVYKIVGIFAVTACCAGGFFMLRLYPLIKKLHKEQALSLKLTQRENELKQKLSLFGNVTANKPAPPSITSSHTLATPNQCAHFFLGVCNKHHIACRSVKTSIKPSNHCPSKCFIDVVMCGKYTDVSELLSYLKQTSPAKIKTLSLRTTPQGVTAHCSLRFLLLPGRTT